MGSRALVDRWARFAAPAAAAAVALAMSVPPLKGEPQGVARPAAAPGPSAAALPAARPVAVPTAAGGPAHGSSPTRGPRAPAVVGPAGSGAAGSGSGGGPAGSGGGPALKPLLTGLLDRQGVPEAGFVGVLGGFVVNVDWSALQPVQGGPLQTAPIDQAVAAARQLNSQGAHLGIRLRVWGGVQAPAWAKDLGGPPIPVYDPYAQVGGTVGRFWSAAYGQAYQQLQAALAARYDSVPEIRDVTVTRCTTVYDEPFIRDTGDAGTVRNLLAAGYTTAADEACQMQQIVAQAAWRSTRSALALNPYQVINPDGTVKTDEGFTEKMMGYCRQVLGARCVLENDSLRQPALSGGYSSMYAAMASLAPGICFQTAVISKVGSLLGTIETAISMGAASVELPYGYQAMGPSAFAPFSTRF